MSSKRGANARVYLDTALAMGRALWDTLAARYGAPRLVAIGLVFLLLASPWAPLTALALVGYVAVTLRRPGLTVALLPLTVPFAYQPKDLFGPQFPVVELLLLVALATSGLALGNAWLRRRRDGTGAAALLDAWDTVKAELRAPFSSQAIALALLGAFSLLTVADPAHRHESIRELRTIIVEPVLYFFLAYYWLRQRALRDLALASFLTGAALVSLIAIGQFITGSHLVVAEGARRVTSVYRHPNNLALYLDRALPLALALLLLAPHPRRERVLVGTSALLGVALLLTASRGAFAALAVALLLLALVASNRAVRVALLGILVAGALLALVVARRRLDALLGGGGSVELRWLIWGSTVQMLRDHPAFGVGLDQFLYQYAPRYVNPAAWSERFTAHPHDLFLDFWVRLGIMGLAWVGWLLLALGARLWRAWRHECTPEHRRLALALAAAFVAATVHGLIDNFYFLIDLATSWWFLLALTRIVTEDPGPGSLALPEEGW